MPEKTVSRPRGRASRVVRVPIPKCRDPFVNTPLVALGPGPDGAERFWISTWNANVGTTAVLIDELGRYRVFRFPAEFPGFYSACPETPDSLWLCGWLDVVVHLDLATGKWKSYKTGAPRALVFQGMAFDPATKKLFAAAFPSPDITAFSFDTVAKKPAKIFRGFSREHYMRFSFPNGDGTWSIILQTPAASLVRWDPRSDELASTPLPAGAAASRLISDAENRWYFPGLGWYDPKTGAFDAAGPRPETDGTWILRRENKAYGVTGNRDISEWDMATGKARTIISAADYDDFEVNFTASGKAVLVTLYGNFYRFDLATGALELAKTLPTDSVQRLDCLLRIDDRRLLGTPFITQRFWEVDLKTGEGRDCGRAAPGGGEVLQTWKVRDKVYMAAYTGGELVEYDPAKPARFPENPHVVADPPGGMRPVAAADDGRFIYYSCSAPYGKLGSVLTKYDTRTGLAVYAPDPIAQEQIVSLRFDRPSKRLICATTYNADCESAPAASDVCHFAVINPQTLAVEKSFAAPKGGDSASVIGPLGRGRYLCAVQKDIPLLGRAEDASWFVLDLADFRAPDPSALRPFPKGLDMILPGPRPGLFILKIGRSVELWDMTKNARVKTLAADFTGYRIAVDRDCLYLCYDKEIVVKPLR